VPPPPVLCVFCASSEEIDDRYRALAAEVGTALAARGWTLVSGGGSVSMMGALAVAARAGGARTIGVIPEALVAWEVADRDADEVVVTQDMRQRKGVMDERSDAFLALPGGIGTLEELIEAWTGLALGMHSKPVVVLDPWGDLAPLRAMVDRLVDGGFVRRGVADLVSWTRTVPDALDAVAAGLAAPPARVAPADPRIRAAELLESDDG
jgi:uncharacterized protein (TIGR00730 family)